MRVLVTGATGFIGSRLTPALVEAGHDVVALVRDAERYDPPAGVEVVEGDLLEPGTLPPAVADVEAAYYLVHSMGSDGDFEERDRRAARNFADAIDEAGVDRLVYLGGLGEDGDRLSAHLRSRREVERILAERDAALTTVRAAIIVGAGSAGFEIVRQLVERLPVMITPQWVHTPCQPIAVDDAIDALVGLLAHPETAGETYEIGGPEVLDYAEMLRRTGRMLGREPLILPVPLLSPRLSSRWVGLMTDVSPSVARPLIEGLYNPVVVDDDRLLSLLGIEPVAFDVALERALDETDGEGER